MKSRTIKLLTAAGLLLVIIILIYSWPTQVPQHASRPVSAWFADLCSLYLPKPPEAVDAMGALKEFGKMDSNAVPYLLTQLHYDRTGIRQKVYSLALRYSRTQPLTYRWCPPNDRRACAAMALRAMGPKAQMAVPDLVEAYVKDPAAKGPAMGALQSIYLGTTYPMLTPGEYRELEARVFAEVAIRHPKLVLQVGMMPASLLSEHFGFGAAQESPTEAVASVTIYPEDVVRGSIQRLQVTTNKFVVRWQYTDQGAQKMRVFWYHHADVGKYVCIRVGDFQTPPGLVWPRDPALTNGIIPLWEKTRTEKFFGVSEKDADAIIAGLKANMVIRN